MSLLETYDMTKIIPVEGSSVAPGTWVRHHDDVNSRGIVIARVWDKGEKATGITVVWTLSPNLNSPFPQVRRVFPSMIANQITSVQPMSLPSGLIFYIDYMYGSGSSSNV